MFCGADEAFVTGIFDYITEGRFPGKADEMLLTENAASIYGMSIGDSVTVQTPAGQMAFTVYSFLFIVAMITVFHIMNSISMSVSARMRTYGAMRAVGMDKRQLTRMIAAEALTYALSGCAVGCAAGIPLHRFLYQQMISNYWGDLWHLPATPLVVMLVLVWMTTVLAVVTPARRICSAPITATINAL